MDKSDFDKDTYSTQSSKDIIDESSHLTISDFENFTYLMFKKLNTTDEDEKIMDQVDEHLRICKSCEAEFKKFLLSSKDYIEYKRKKELMKAQGISEPLEYVMNMPNEEFMQKCRVLSRSDAFSIIASGFYDNIEAISAVRERAKELSLNIELYDDRDIGSMVAAIAHRIVNGWK